VNKPVKLPEIRKEVFTKARESLGLSKKDLSGMACLSVRQIEQIENGQGSCFYGPQIKFTAAKKVAGLLKLTPEEAFDFAGNTPPAKAVEVEEKLQEEAKTSAVQKNSKTEKEIEKEEEKKGFQPTTKEKVDELKSQTVSNNKNEISKEAIDHDVNAKAAAESKKKIFMLVVIGAAVIFSAVNLRSLFFHEPVKQEAVIIQEVAPEPTPAAESVADTKAVAAQAPAVVPETAPATPAVSAECPPADATALNYKPDAPKKAGDMVYLQSKTTQTVCVVDATGKTQNKTLEPGVGVSVYGKPPLRVLTGALNQLDLYYQGTKVRIGNASAKTINLEPAEIIAPVTPLVSTDSQLR
jgi:transcriptional regulator with XRE-family HTH domain